MAYSRIASTVETFPSHTFSFLFSKASPLLNILLDPIWYEEQLGSQLIEDLKLSSITANIYYNHIYLFSQIRIFVWHVFKSLMICLLTVQLKELSLQTNDKTFVDARTKHSPMSTDNFFIHVYVLVTTTKSMVWPIKKPKIKFLTDLIYGKTKVEGFCYFILRL